MTTSRDAFHALARTHRAVPVSRELLADLTTPVGAFLRCVGDEPGFLLESVENGERWSRYSFVGRRPHATFTSRGGVVTQTGSIPGDPVAVDRGMLAVLDDLLDRFAAPPIEGLPPLHAGLVGYLGYDVVREVEHLPDRPDDQLGFADAVIEVIGELAVYDHWRQRVVLIAVSLLPEQADAATIDAAYDDAVARLDQLAVDGARPIDEPMLAPPTDDPPPDVRASISDDDYMRAVEVAKEYIRAGDIFQVVLSKRFDLDLDADPVDLYRVLRQINPSPYMYLVRQPDLTIVGCSPEPLVRVEGDRVISRPIAGTRRRGRTDAEDRRMASELAEDPKEIAEHVMLVDLARNDLGRVAEFGSLEVAEMMTLERYSHVMHLTSEVQATRRPDVSVVDVIRATLPAGTLSGAPKVRAMEIIDELEPAARGPYGGVVGYVDFSGNLDTAIVIRTLLCADGKASIQAGAGVVADSRPELENLECWNKAQALLRAVEPARRMTAARNHGG